MIELYTVRYAVIGAHGVIERTGECSLESLYHQVESGQQIIDLPDGVADDTHYWDGAGFVEYPPRPGLWSVWDGAGWIDPRTPEDIEALAEAEMVAARAGASLPKLQFVLRVVQAGILSQASGLAMLDGYLPDELDGLTDAMSEMEQFELRAKLKGAVQIERLDPFIVASGQHLGLTLEQMDAVFGIVSPE